MRERGDDLPLLVRHFLRRFGRELGRDVREAAPEALERLRATRGRATSGSCRASSSRPCCGPAATSSSRPSSRNPSGGWPPSPAAPSGKEPGVEEFLVRLRLGPDVRDLYAEAHRNLDRLLLPRVLEHTAGSQHQAALLLGIARQTLRLKLRDLGPSAPRPAEAEGDPG